MNIKAIVVIVTLLGLLAGGLALRSQTLLTKEIKSEVITKLAKVIEQKYVLVDKALYEISNDKHLKLRPESDVKVGPTKTMVLAGNIRLLTVKDLMGSIGEIDQAMTALSTTSALIMNHRSRPCINPRLNPSWSWLSSFYS